MSVEIEKAKLLNLDDIEKIYNSVHDSGESTGWVKGVYPTRESAKNAISNDEMYVMKDNQKVVVVAVINKKQVKEYKNAKWNYDAKEDEIMVIHGLAVDMNLKNMGYGTRFIKFYEEYAKKNNCKLLRMDTNVINKKARRLYNKLVFSEVGVVDSVFNGIPNVKLVCFEKEI